MQDHKKLRDFEDLFKTLQYIGESDSIEAKAYIHALGKSFPEVVSAFSNEPGLGGGYILMGIKENEFTGEYEIVGVAESDILQQQIGNQCKLSFNCEVSPIIKVIQHPQGTILLVYIPEAKSSDKPIYIKRKGVEKGAFRRSGSTNHVCSRQDLIYLLQNNYERNYDEEIARYATIEDFDPEALMAYRREVKKIRGNAPELEYDDPYLAQAPTFKYGVSQYEKILAHSSQYVNMYRDKK